MKATKTTAQQRKRRLAPASLELRGIGIVLRPAQLSDAPGIQKNIRNREIARFTGIPYPYPKEGAVSFLKHVLKAVETGDRFLFVIRRYNSDEAIGAVDLFRRGPPQWRRMELGYWLAKPYWNKGIMTQAVKLVLGFAFDKLKLHRVDVGHFVPNEGSRRVIEKCWFRREGAMRDGASRGKHWYNLVFYGLLEQEYRQIRSK
jgi:RimJ/RimL family protein N-acetyltransferase